MSEKSRGYILLAGGGHDCSTRGAISSPSQFSPTSIRGSPEIEKIQLQAGIGHLRQASQPVHQIPPRSGKRLTWWWFLFFRSPPNDCKKVSGGRSRLGSISGEVDCIYVHGRDERTNSERSTPNSNRSPNLLAAPESNFGKLERTQQPS